MRNLDLSPPKPRWISGYLDLSRRGVSRRMRHRGDMGRRDALPYVCGGKKQVEECGRMRKDVEDGWGIRVIDNPWSGPRARKRKLRDPGISVPCENLNCNLAKL